MNIYIYVFFTASALSPGLSTFAVCYTQIYPLFHYSELLLFSLACINTNGRKTSEVVSTSSPHAWRHIVPQEPEFAVSAKTVSLPALAGAHSAPTKYSTNWLLNSKWGGGGSQQIAFHWYSCWSGRCSMHFASPSLGVSLEIQ